MSNLRLSGLYNQFTAGTSPSVEWAWLVARVAVALIAVAATSVAYERFEGAMAVPVAAIAVVVYTGLLAVLLKRGYVRAAFMIGFILDNVVIVIAWWLTAKNTNANGSESDLWLILMPVTIVGMARTGPRVGLIYVGLMIALLAGMTLAFEPDDSYAVAQLPVRMVFLGIVGALTTWLVSELNLERENAEELQAEAETLARISQIIGSSLDPSEVFSRFAVLVRTLIPYEMLVLAELDNDQTTLRVMNVDLAGEDTGDVPVSFALPEDKGFVEFLTRRAPQNLNAKACKILLGNGLETESSLLANAQSILVTAVVSGDRVVGTLFACSRCSNSFDSEHLRALSRISELISASMTNLQVYGQAIQLANEREARLTLDATNRRLQEDYEARNFFLSAVSHELRTPLTSIIAFNDLLLRNRNNNLSDREMKQLKLIRSNSTQLATLVNDLLDLSYIGSSKVKLTPECFNPAEAIQQIIESVRPMLTVRNQELRWQPKTADQTVIADRQRFSQITANLLSNASKYSPEKTEISLHWSIDAEKDGTFEMTVTDHGSGISELHQSQLFQPFFRAPEHRAEKIPGTGLGLVIAKSLLEAHGGGIELHSTQSEDGNGGTRVRVWFPANGSGMSSALSPGDAA